MMPRFLATSFLPGPLITTTKFDSKSYQFPGKFTMGVLAFCRISVPNLGGFVAWPVFYGFFSGIAVTLPAIVLPYVCPILAVYGTRLGMVHACTGAEFLTSAPVASAATSTTDFLGSQIWTGACCFEASLYFILTGFKVLKRRLLCESRKGKKHCRSKFLRFMFEC